MRLTTAGGRRGQRSRPPAVAVSGRAAGSTQMGTASSVWTAACGARIGCMITKNADLMNAALKFAQARLSPPTLEQVLGEATLDTPQSYFEEVNKEYDSRRKLLVSRLSKMEGVLCPNPGGAFYALVRLPIDDSDRFCQWMLEEFQHNGHTVMMAPGTGFYSTPGLGKNEVRVAYVLKLEDLNGAMDCLEAALKVYPGRK